MRIAFITDPHLDKEGEKPMGVDVRQNFLDALAYATKLKPLLLVIGGDLCNSAGDPAVYGWVKQQLDALPYPYCIIPGNHDDSVMLAEAFNLTHHLHGDELYYALPLEGRPALFLDSAKGQFSLKQWQWLRDYLAALRDRNLLIFMHHPPLPADALFMDTHYPFWQADEFYDIAKDLTCHVTVVCGHYHVDKFVQRGNLTVLLSPATFYQIKSNTAEFAVDHYRVGIREMNLTTHGTNSEVHYLDPAQ